MRNLQIARIFSCTLILCAILYSCRHKESADHKNYILFDNGRVGFFKPAGSYPVPNLTKVMKVVNPNIIFALKLDTINYPSQFISVAKYVTDTIMPMEMAFINETVKYPSEGWKKRLADFGVYDKDGRRYRYKVSFVDYEVVQHMMEEFYRNSDSVNLSKPEHKVQLKIMYYFMKNDLDSVMYELTIGTDTTMFRRSDSLLTRLAESFKFFK